MTRTPKGSDGSVRFRMWAAEMEERNTLLRKTAWTRLRARQTGPAEEGVLWFRPLPREAAGQTDPGWELATKRSSLDVAEQCCSEKPPELAPYGRLHSRADVLLSLSALCAFDFTGGHAGTQSGSRTAKQFTDSPSAHGSEG